MIIFFFFDTPFACHETLFTYVENMIDERNMDEDIPENVAVFSLSVLPVFPILIGP